MVHLRVQPSSRDRGERALAIIRAIRRRAVRESDPRLADQQVQGLRIRYHDELRGGGGRNSEPERL